MKTVALTFAAILAGTAASLAASATNTDSEPRTIVVTEGGTQSELLIAAGETIQFCPNGCFVTMPNGDREALTGGEAIDITSGRARFR